MPETSNLIDRFNADDFRLLCAVAGLGEDEVYAADESVCLAFDDLIEHEPQTPKDRKALTRFLTQRFLTSDYTGTETREKVSLKLLDLLDGETG